MTTALPLPAFRRLATSQLDEAAALKDEGNALLAAGDPELASHRYAEAADLLDELQRMAPEALARPDFADVAKRMAHLRRTADGNLAQAMLKEQRFGEAARVAERAIKATERESAGAAHEAALLAKLWFRLAQARRGEGALDDARDALKAASALAPNNNDIARALRSLSAELKEASKRASKRFGGMFDKASYKEGVAAREDAERQQLLDERRDAWRAAVTYADGDAADLAAPEPLRAWLDGGGAAEAAVDYVSAALVRGVAREADARPTKADAPPKRGMPPSA